MSTATVSADADWSSLAKELKAAADKVSTVEHLPQPFQTRLTQVMARGKRLADRWAGLVDDLRKVGRDDTNRAPTSRLRPC